MIDTGPPAALGTARGLYVVFIMMKVNGIDHLKLY